MKRKRYARGKKFNLKGRRFGSLLVIRLIRIRGKARYTLYWLCRCNCGKIMRRRQYDLLVRGIASCGASGCKIRFGKRAQISRSDAARRQLFSQYVTRAASHQRDFSLTRKQAYRLYESSCFHCGRNAPC